MIRLEQLGVCMEAIGANVEPLKCTEYFKHTRSRPDRVAIEEVWIRQVILNPAQIEVQSDGRIRKWGWIDEAGRYLRVVLLADGETVHNAFFDRSHKGAENEN